MPTAHFSFKLRYPLNFLLCLFLIGALAHQASSTLPDSSHASNNSESNCSQSLETINHRLNSTFFGPSRDLKTYINIFKDFDFDRVLQIAIGSGGVWFDFGAEDATAQIQALQFAKINGRLHPNTGFVGFSRMVDQRKWEAIKIAGEELRPHFGYAILDLSDQKSLDVNTFFNIGTDFLGALSYDSAPDRVLQNYINHMKPHPFSVLMVNINDRINTVNTKSGNVSFVTWIESIPGLQIRRSPMNPGYISIMKKPGYNQPITIPTLYPTSVDQWELTLPPKRFFSVDKND